MKEICNHCGRSVRKDSELFIGRVPDGNDFLTRIGNGLMYPEGDFVCSECDEKTSDDFPSADGFFLSTLN
jgi:hypothetical protein